MAQIVLLTANDCNVCEDVKRRFEEKYADELKSGEAAVYNVDENEDAKEFAAKCGLGPGPQLVVVTETEKLLTRLDLDKELPSQIPEVDTVKESPNA